MFGDLEFQFDTVAHRLRELAFLNSNVRIRLVDERDGQEAGFHYAGGLREFVQFLNETKNSLHSDPIYISKERENVSIELAILSAAFLPRPMTS